MTTTSKSTDPIEGEFIAAGEQEQPRWRGITFSDYASAEARMAASMREALDRRIAKKAEKPTFAMYTSASYQPVVKNPTAAIIMVTA